MISFDFEYYKPTTIEEAISLFVELESQNKEPLYYSGGTEIISMSRMNDIFTKAVIDIKEIPECNIFEVQDNKLVIGSAVTLTKICEANLFPLLARVSRYTADHTSRNKITLGGNICGKIPYRETMLPFLICDSQVVIAGKDGKKALPVSEIFDRKLKLNKGELLVQVITDSIYLDLPYESIKRTKQERIDYPLISIAAIKIGNMIKIGLSGLCAFPFRSLEIEKILNDNNTSIEEKINNVLNHIPYSILNDIQGSSEYRKFVLKNMLSDTLEKVGGA